MQIHKEKKHAKFRFSFILLFIFASFAACFALYMNSDENDAAMVSKIQAEELDNDTNDVLYEEYLNVVNPVPKSDRAADGYFDNAVILAPEQMRGLSDYGAVARENLFTGEFTPFDIMSGEAASFLSGRSYESIYIFWDESSVSSPNFDSLSELIGSINEKNDTTKIYLVSAIPLKADDETDTLTNSDIEGFNSLMLNFANEKKVNYIDLNTFLVGNDGKLPKGKAESVGKRLKKDTYLEIADYLLTHIA